MSPVLHVLYDKRETLRQARYPQEIEMSDTIEQLQARVADLKAACVKQDEEVCQVLGRALGYPWFKDDQKNFPGSTEEHGVCVGEHVGGSIAAEAAAKITAQGQRIAELEAEQIKSCNLWHDEVLKRAAESHHMEPLQERIAELEAELLSVAAILRAAARWRYTASDDAGAAAKASYALCKAVDEYARKHGLDRVTPKLCPACNGNDADMPCAYPGDNQPGCIRDERLAEKRR